MGKLLSTEENLKRLFLKPIRTCRSLHMCCVCPSWINSGDKYYDGGESNRAHERCVQEALKSKEVPE